MLTLSTPVSKLYYVGPKTVQKLKNLGIEKVKDLLFYFPRSWVDFSNPSKISEIHIGEVNTIRGKILEIKNKPSPKKRMFLTHALIEDDSGQIRAIWYNQPFLVKTLRKGSEWIFSGKVNLTGHDREMNNPIYEREAIILPIYSETEGLSSRYLRRIIKPLLKITNRIEEFLPLQVLHSQNLLTLSTSVKEIHFPENILLKEKAKERLAFEELFLLNLKMNLAKRELQEATSLKIKIDLKLLKKFVQSLPFHLTNAQRISAWQIIKDLAKSRPMNRLLEGEVGSGKTVVATMAALSVIKNGYQVVWLAPTEILASQHYKTVTKLLKPFKIKIGLLTRSQTRISEKNFAKEKLKTDIKERKIDLTIGTHALIQKDVKFPNLGLVIIDEQHRFGVKQRAALKHPSSPEYIPHLLSMTATPIPRTLALTLYGDLDLSIIDELPLGRRKIITKIIPPSKRETAYNFIRGQVKQDRQVFVICPLIEELKRGGVETLFDLDRKSAKREFEKLSKEVFPDLRIGLLHGKMKGKEKEKVMVSFMNGKLDILVSTAVVEVGIDVPNASVMMIEGAERFGLAQLHQFRGRVGRSTHQSYCFLFAQDWSESTRKRLIAMEKYDNGFQLAEIDLKLRGPGELVGVRQSGFPDLKMASLFDIVLIKRAKEEAEKIGERIEDFPKLERKLKEFEVERHLE